MTSLAESIRSAVHVLRVALDDLPESAVFQARSEVTYNPSLGTVDAEWTDTVIDAVFSSYSSAEKVADPGIKAEDFKCLVWSEDLAAAPAVHDRITRTDGSIWAVVAVRTDPVRAVWILQLRRSGDVE